MERKIIKARKHTVEDVKRIIKEMDKKVGKNYSRLPIKTSRKMTRALGGAVCRITINRITKKQKVEALEFKFSQFFLDAYLTEQDFQDIVQHEYSHLYANELHQENCNHDRRYKAVCKSLGIEHMGGYTCNPQVGMAFQEAINTYKINKARG